MERTPRTMAALLAALISMRLATVLLAPPAAAAPEEGSPSASPTATAAEIRVDSAQWESGYGVKFFQVVGTVTNRGQGPLGAALVRTELLGDDGTVVGATECWNGDAEVLGDLRGSGAQAKLAEAKVKPIAPGATDKWRCTFLDEDAPKFASHRSRVSATLPAP
jgi:hypothetical protein